MIGRRAATAALVAGIILPPLDLFTMIEYGAITFPIGIIKPRSGKKAMSSKLLWWLRTRLKASGRGGNSRVRAIVRSPESTTEISTANVAFFFYRRLLLQ